MTLTTYFIYLTAVALLVVTPGPTMLMSMTNAATYGTTKALMSTAGSVTAVLGVMILSSMGLGAVLAASNTAFTVLKVVGAAYLIYLGITTFLNADRAVLATASPLAPTRSARSLYLQGWMVGASNPKALLFFSAFFPQFIDPQAAFVPQFAILASTFIAIEFSVAPWLRESGRTRAFNRVSGSLFAGMGALLLLMRRPS